MNKRLEKLREALQEKELDAILISTEENRRYVSGFSGSAGYLLVSKDDAVLATDFRYVEQAGKQSPDFRVERIAGGHAWLPKLTAEIGVKRVGFESQQMTYNAYTLLQKAIEDAEGSQKPEMVSTAGIVERLRAFKDADELKLLARASEIADEAFERKAQAIKRTTGSTRPIQDPIEAFIESSAAIVVSSIKTRIAGSIVEMADEQGVGGFITQITPAQDGKPVHVAAIRRQL